MNERHIIFSRSVLKIFLLGGVFLAIFSSSAEIALRLNPIKRFQVVPYLGSSHRQLEIQLARIENFAKDEGGIDCLFIGSSMVWLGINPEVFSEAYGVSTSENLRCFNFGIATMPASAAGVLAKILVEQYHPKILIFGTSPRDYAIPLDSEDAEVILDTPWVQYQEGEFSIPGWLYTNSSLYSNLGNLNRFLRFDKTVLTDIGTSKYDRFGFLPKTRPILAENIQAGVEDAKKWLTNYQVMPENVGGLREIAALNQDNLHVIIFETPVQPSYYDYFSNKETDIDTFVQTVQSVSEEYGLTFILVSDPSFIPAEGWWNENHLNLVGANVFSVWLAEQISPEIHASISNQ